LPDLRIALISIAGERPVDLRVGGHSLAWHQVQAALALACERIVCLADAPGPALATLQREVEGRNATFHAIAHHRALSGLVRAADTLLVFAPGVLPDRDWLAGTFGARAGVAVLPADGAVEQGFERIDRDRAWAGVLATRGDAVESLGVLEPDADPIAGLLRVALQRGANAVALPEKWLDDGRWALIGTPDAAERYQDRWYQRHVPEPPLELPGKALAHRLARTIVARVDNAARTAGIIAGGVLLALGSALGGYLGHSAAGLAGLTAASGLFDVGAALTLLSRAGSGEQARRWPGHARLALLDIALVMIAASPVTFQGWTDAFAALMLIGVMRLAAEGNAPRILRPLADRTLVLLALCFAAAAGALGPSVAILSLLGLSLRIFWPRTTQLTPV
jgi:hypothetical protein